MSSGADMTNAVRQRMAEDGVDLNAAVDMDGTSAQGTVESQGATPPAGESNTDTRGTPDSIPYSRFQEVNSQLQQLRQYSQLQDLGIEPDSAVRLANFEQAYMQDPIGTLTAMIDQQDLPDSQKSALKTLLASQVAAERAGAADADQTDGQTMQLPDEVTEAVGYIRELRDKEAERDSQQRLDHVVGHWQQLDEKDGVNASARQRLIYVQSAAGSGQEFQTLEQLSEAARNMWLEDRDANLGAAVQRRGPGSPLAVPSGGVPPTEPLPAPTTMAEARKRIQADIAAGRLPDLQSGT